MLDDQMALRRHVLIKFTRGWDPRDLASAVLACPDDMGLRASDVYCLVECVNFDDPKRGIWHARCPAGVVTLGRRRGARTVARSSSTCPGC
jgi:hypothetical protein